MDGGKPATPERCPACGAALPAAACPVCTELGHLDYLRAWLASPEISRALMYEQDRQFRVWVMARSSRLHMPPPATPAPPAPPATPARPVPAAECEPAIPARPVVRPAPAVTPPPPPQPRPVTPPRPAPPPPPPPRPKPVKVVKPPAGPSEWDRFREATGFSWLYVVGVLFIAAGLFWAVAAAGQGPMGRLLLAAIVTGLTATALWSGRVLADRYKLEVGGQALLAGGAMLVSASLLAWMRLITGEVVVGSRLLAWLGTVALAAGQTRARRWPSQLLVANTFAAVAVWDGAIAWASPGQGASWLGLLFCPFAAANLVVCRRSPHPPLANAARGSAYAFVALASLGLAVAAGGDQLTVALLARLVGAVLLGGLFVALAHQTQRGAPIGLAALTWWLASLILGPWGFDGLGVWLAATGLLYGSTRSGWSPELAQWYVGSAITLSVLALAPVTTTLLGATASWPRTASAWALAGTYTALAIVARDLRALAAAVAIATLAALATSLLLPLGALSAAWWLLGEAAAVLLIASRLREVEWPDGKPARLLGWCVLGLLVFVIARCPLGVESVPALAVCAGLSVLLSLHLAEPNLLYVSAAVTLEAVLLLALVHKVNPILACQAAAAVLALVAWLGGTHWQPLEVVSAVLMLGGPLLLLPTALTHEGMAGMWLAAAYWAAPAVPAVARRTKLPELTAWGIRGWAVALAGVAATASLGRGPLDQPSWVAMAGWLVVLAVVRRGLSADNPWSPALRGATMLPAWLLAAGSSQLGRPYEPLAVLLAAQLAIWLVSDGAEAWLAAGWLAWLVAILPRCYETGWPYTVPQAAQWAVADAVTGAGYLVLSRRRPEDWGFGLTCLLLVPTYLAAGWIDPRWQPLLGAATGLAVVLSARLATAETTVVPRALGALTALVWLAVSCAAGHPDAAPQWLTLVVAEAACLLAAAGDERWLAGAWLAWLVAILPRCADPRWPQVGSSGWSYAAADTLTGIGFLLASRGRPWTWAMGLTCLLLVPTYLLAGWIDPVWQPLVGVVTGLAVVLSTRFLSPETAVVARPLGALNALIWLAVSCLGGQPEAAPRWLALLAAQAAFVLAADDEDNLLGAAWATWLLAVLARHVAIGWPVTAGGPAFAAVDTLIGAGYLVASRGRPVPWALGLSCLLLVPTNAAAAWLAPAWHPLLGVVTALAVVLSARLVSAETAPAARAVGALAAAAWLALSYLAGQPAAPPNWLTLVVAEAAFLLAAHGDETWLAAAWLAWLVVALPRGAQPGWPYAAATGLAYATADTLVGVGFLVASRRRPLGWTLGLICLLLVPNYLASAWIDPLWQPLLGAVTGLAVVLSARLVSAETASAARALGALTAAAWLAMSCLRGAPASAPSCLTLLVAQAAFILAAESAEGWLAAGWMLWLAAVVPRCGEPGWPGVSTGGPGWAAIDTLIAAGYLLTSRGSSLIWGLGLASLLLVPVYLVGAWLDPAWLPLLGAATALAVVLSGRITELDAARPARVVGGAAAVAWCAAVLTHGAPGEPAHWLVLLVAQAALILAAEELDWALGLAWLVWAAAVGLRADEAGWPRELAGRVPLAALDLALAAAYLYAARRLERSSATALAALALLPLALVPAGLAGAGVALVHQPLLGGSYVLALVLLGALWRRADWLPGTQAALGLAAAGALLTLSTSLPWSPTDDTFALLCLYAVLAAPLSPLAGLWLGQAAALWGVAVMWPLEEPQWPILGLRLGFIVLADVVVAAALRAKPKWRAAWLTPAALLAVVSLPLLFQPPSRPSVLGLLVLASAAVTAAWLVERRELNDAGFACAWLAGIMVLYDTASHGQGELLPYRSLDLYLAPMAIYTLAISERRSASPAGLRLMAVVMLLGSLLVSALAGASWLHSAALFVAVAAAVAYGVLRADLAIRYAGLAAFAAWFLVFLWRQQENSRWLLIPLLVVLGMGAMWLAVNQERRQRQ